MAYSSAAPVTLEIESPLNLSRPHLLLKVFLGFIYVGIPHGIILYFYGIATYIASLIAFVAVLITTRYPQGIFDFIVGYHRWNTRVAAYSQLFMTDKYPPFSASSKADYPVDLRIQRPENLSRGLALLKFLFGWLYVGIPHGLALIVYGLLVLFAMIYTFFYILFTGRYPLQIFHFTVGLLRWSMRVDAYLSYMRDEYPPFNGRP